MEHQVRYLIIWLGLSLKLSKKNKNNDRIKDMLINVATKETCITINTIRNRYVELDSRLSFDSLKPFCWKIMVYFI